MATVALVGGDGSGKTTLAEALLAAYPDRFKYLYMGASAGSANVALPTTRIVWAIKVMREKRARRARGQSIDGPLSLHGMSVGKAEPGRLRASARLINRLAEEALRQVVSWIYQVRGYVVLYDRHFLFDYSTNRPPRRVTYRIHNWLLANWYPKPHLTIFLDAPPALIRERKSEVSLEYLEDLRQRYLAVASTVPRFITIDAGQSASAVSDAANAAITQFLEERPVLLSRLLERARSQRRRVLG